MTCLRTQHSVPWPGLEPGPLDPGTSALTMRPPRCPPSVTRGHCKMGVLFSHSPAECKFCSPTSLLGLKQVSPPTPPLFSFTVHFEIFVFNHLTNGKRHSVYYRVLYNNPSYSRLLIALEFPLANSKEFRRE